MLMTEIHFDIYNCLKCNVTVKCEQQIKALCIHYTHTSWFITAQTFEYFGSKTCSLNTRVVTSAAAAADIIVLHPTPLTDTVRHRCLSAESQSSVFCWLQNATEIIIIFVHSFKRTWM